VTVTPKGESYGRVVAEIATNEEKPKALGLELVSRGLAEVDQRYSKSKLLLNAESQAKKEKLGLWQSASPIHPWDWRKQQRVRDK
jgi:endonuclease YncB( thermonuclease family)